MMITLREILYSRSSQPMNDFVFMMGLWCQQTGISRQQYCGLLQVLKLLKDISPISLLPLKLSTLKMNVQAQLPLLALHQKQIPVLSAKLSTLSAADKKLISSSMSWMYFIDPIPLIRSLPNSRAFSRKMHIGMTHFVTILLRCEYDWKQRDRRK